MVHGRIVTLLAGRLIRPGGDAAGTPYDLGQVLVEHGGQATEQGAERLLATFPSATDALRAAVALQRAVELDTDLSVGVALHSGAPGQEVGSEFRAVIVRQLCERAAAGQILCTNVVVGLLGRRLRFGLTDLGEWKLEWVPYPVTVFDVRYETRPGGAARDHVPTVGREAEVRQIREWWAEALAGRGGVGLVGGEPGIGKTRLVEEAAEQIEREGAFVLWGHCYEREGMPYAPIAEAIQTLVLASPADELRTDLADRGPALAQLVPALRSIVRDIPEAVPLQPDEERSRLLDAVGQLVMARSERDPIVLCVDDLQWVDNGSIILLSHLRRFAGQHRVLILGTYRPEAARDRPFGRLLDAVADDPGVPQILLEGLAPGAVGQLLASLADHEVPIDAVQLIAAETHGNPFFVREVIRYLIEEGTIFRGADGRWISAGPLSDLGIREGVRDVIGRRLSRLSDAANRLLSAASAFDAAFRFDVVAAVAALPETEARHALDQAEAARLVQPATAPGAGRFSHDLVRHTIYEDLPSPDRIRLHRQAAEVLELTYGPAPTPLEASEIARQYHQSAALPGAERGVDPALAAAGHAEATGGHDEAAAFLRIALDMLRPGEERQPRLLGRLGIALAWALRFEEGVPVALEAGEAIAAAKGSQAAAEYLAEAAYVCTMAGGTVPSWVLARKGLEYAPSGTIAWARMLAFDFQRQEAEDRAHRGIPVDTPARRESARILRAARLDPLGPSPMEAVFDDRDEALTSTNLLVLMNYAGEYTRVLPLLEAAAKDAETKGRFARAARAYAGMAICQSTLGRLRDGDASVERAQALSTRIGVPVFPVIYAEDCMAGALDERWDRVVTTVRPLVAAHAPSLAWAEGHLVALAARADARLGRDEEALGSLAALVPWLERSPAWGVNFIFTTCHAAETLWALGRSDYAEVVERALLEKVIAPDFRCGMVDGRLALGRLCALQGRHDEALRWWAQARRLLQAQEAATLLAIVDYDEAVMLARRGRPGDVAVAGERLAAARRQFAALGMPGWARRAAPSGTAAV